MTAKGVLKGFLKGMALDTEEGQPEEGRIGRRWLCPTPGIPHHDMILPKGGHFSGAFLLFVGRFFFFMVWVTIRPSRGAGQNSWGDPLPSIDRRRAGGVFGV